MKTHLDLDGRLRGASERFNVNLFVHEEDAESSARESLRPGSGCYIWRTTDGLYDWSAIPDRLVPWVKDATLVKSVGIEEPEGMEGP